LQENVAQYQVRDISSKKTMRLFLLWDFMSCLGVQFS
jgi:hypothetical protein